MPRRALIATLVTTFVGAVAGAVLGAGVGRVIALFGDATVQTSVPMVFCGTLGFFVGGASAAKGSLERFGAKRAALGSTVAAILLVVVVGGASLARLSGVLIGLIGLAAIVLAAVGATLVGAPQHAPAGRGAAPASAPRAPKEPRPPRKSRRSRKASKDMPGLGGDDGADPSDLFDADGVVAPPIAVRAAPKPYRPRAGAAARRVPEPEPEPDEDELDDEDWVPEDEAVAPTAAIIRNWEPEDGVDEADEDVTDEDEAEPEPEAAPPAPRPRRDRPLRKGDA